ncbi:MAG: hypothetical protein LBM23_01220 [Propionibacteriaceae bacterium]|jgi:hypothetical protein|nr:hypothetical protein [Propionibacteriaceae bacterium]
MRTITKVGAVFASALLAVSLGAAQASAVNDDVVTYDKAKGWTDNGDGLGYVVEKMQCEGTENEDKNAPDGPYLYWKFTANTEVAMTITGPWGTVEMDPAASGQGSWGFYSDYYSLDELLGQVYVTYDAESTSDKNPQLNVSHGCAPVEEPEDPAWCSPGFWKNIDLHATSDVWARTGYSPDGSFNELVAADWFNGVTIEGDATLLEVVTGDIKVKGKGEYANAVAAMLTDALPGYYYDADFRFASEELGFEHCPFDRHNVEQPIGPATLLPEDAPATDDVII